MSWGIDLQTEHERFLTEEHFKCPTFVTDYPAEIKAFYMRLNDDGKTVAAADCLVPGIGEIIGGSQREERLEVLERRIAELGMDPEQYKYYLDLRRYGTCKHAVLALASSAWSCTSRAWATSATSCRTRAPLVAATSKPGVVGSV